MYHTLHFAFIKDTVIGLDQFSDKIDDTFRRIEFSLAFTFCKSEFAVRAGLSKIKQLLLKVAGRKYDKMTAKKNQKYFFIFVHEDG